MSALDKQPGIAGTMYKTIGDTSLGVASTSKVQIGGAGVSTTVPAGMDTLLGIYAHLNPTTLADNEAVNAWGYLDTEDGFNLKPFEFLYPNVGCIGAAPSAPNSTPGIFYPVNCPVVPGGRIAAYGQLYEAVAVAPYASVTYLFGKNIVLPKSMDDHPGRQRWRKVGHTPAATADGWGTENQYQFTLSARGGAITEIGGLCWVTAQTPALAGGCTMQITSADVPVFPMEFNLNAYGGALAASAAHDGSDGVTRRPCSAFGERVVHIDAYLANMAGLTHITGFFVSMIEFVRRGE